MFCKKMLMKKNFKCSLAFDCIESICMPCQLKYFVTAALKGDGVSPGHTI